MDGSTVVDAQVPSGRVGFTHKALVDTGGEYGTSYSELSLWIDLDLQAPNLEAEIAAKAALLKEQAFLQLGVDYTFNNDGVPIAVSPFAKVNGQQGVDQTTVAPQQPQAQLQQQAPAQQAAPQQQGGMNAQQVAEHFPGAQVVQAQPQQQAPAQQAAPQQQQPQGGGQPQLRQNEVLAPSGIIVIKPYQAQQLDTWLPASCGDCGNNKVWDNRGQHPHFGGSGSDKKPYYKCSNKDCGAGFWPPRNSG